MSHSFGIADVEGLACEASLDPPPLGIVSRGTRDRHAFAAQHDTARIPNATGNACDAQFLAHDEPLLHDESFLEHRHDRRFPFRAYRRRRIHLARRIEPHALDLHVLGEERLVHLDLMLGHGLVDTDALGFARAGTDLQLLLDDGNGDAGIGGSVRSGRPLVVLAQLNSLAVGSKRREAPPQPQHRASRSLGDNKAQHEAK
jgi:hypothetical protein